MRSKRIDKILVVAGDRGRPREDKLTGVLEFTQALSSSYKVDSWILSEKGSPDVDELLEYDAIIWTTGDYWDDSINDEDAALLSKYIFAEQKDLALVLPDHPIAAGFAEDSAETGNQGRTDKLRYAQALILPLAAILRRIFTSVGCALPGNFRELSAGYCCGWL